MIIIDFLLGFILLPVRFLFIFMGIIFSLGMISFFTFILLFYLSVRFYLKLFNKSYKKFFYLSFLCIITNVLLIKLFDLNTVVFLSYFLSPFELIAFFGVLIAIIFRGEKNINE